MVNNERLPLSSLADSFAQDRIKEIFIDRLKTGFPRLDQILGGGLAEGMTVLGAAAGLGKSTFILQIAQNVAKTGRTVLFFSLEMTALRIISKAISRQLFYDSENEKDETALLEEADKLLNKDFVYNFDERKWKCLDRARKIVAQETENLYVIEGGRDMYSAEHICRYVDKFMKESNSNNRPLVIVDYLQILALESQNQRGESKYVVDYSIRQLRELSISKRIPLLLISSLNRAGYASPIRLDSFKETGNIEYSADMVMGLQFSAVHEQQISLEKEKAKDPREVEIVILKQRYGKSGDVAVKFRYYARYDCFCEESSGEMGRRDSNGIQKNKVSRKRSTEDENRSTVHKQHESSQPNPQNERIVCRNL